MIGGPRRVGVSPKVTPKDRITTVEKQKLRDFVMELSSSLISVEMVVAVAVEVKSS